jgi:hypothetical protein
VEVPLVEQIKKMIQTSAQLQAMDMDIDDIHLLRDEVGELMYDRIESTVGMSDAAMVMNLPGPISCWARPASIYIVDTDRIRTTTHLTTSFQMPSFLVSMSLYDSSGNLWVSLKKNTEASSRPTNLPYHY